MYGFDAKTQSEHVQIRTDMLKERAQYRREDENGEIPGDTLKKRKEATKACKKENRRQARQRRKELEEEISNNSEKHRYAEVWRGARWLAGAGVGPSRRNFYRPTWTRPDLEDWKTALKKPGAESGYKAEYKGTFKEQNMNKKRI